MRLTSSPGHSCRLRDTGAAPKAGKSTLQHRRKHVVYHRGKQVEIPLSRYIRNHFPASKAAAILAEPGQFEKSVVGAWQAIQRDPTLRKQFTRKVAGKGKAVKAA